MAKAIIIPTNGQPYYKMVSGLNEIQEAVGGWIDAVVHPSGDFCGYVHDEGLVIGYDENIIATAVFGRYLVGDVVVVGTDDDGNDIDVPEFAAHCIGFVWNAKQMRDDAVRNIEAFSK